MERKLRQLLRNARAAIRSLPERKLQLAPPVVIGYLYAYVLLLLPAMLWWKRCKVRLAPGAWLGLWGLPLGLNEVLLKPLFPESHNLVSDWYIFNHYLLLTLYGYVLASMPGAWQWLAHARKWSLLAGLASFVALIASFELGIIEHDSIADGLGANIFTWLWMMVFLGYGYRYLAFANPLLRWARDASYPIYILHQTVIVVIGYYVIQCPWSPWTKYFAILILSMAACVVLYQACIRRLAFLRLIFGMKLQTTDRKLKPAESLQVAGDDLR